MKCDFHPTVDASEQCSSCQIHLCGVCADYSSNEVRCAKCASMAELTERHARPEPSAAIKSAMVSEARIANGEEASAIDKHSSSSAFDLMVLVGIVACFGFMGVRWLDIFGFSSALTPEQIAAEEQAKESLELCVDVFWDIAAVLGQGETPGPSLRCDPPAGANLVTEEAGNIIVRHPNPELYDLSDFFVSSADPVPTLVE